MALLPVPYTQLVSLSVGSSVYIKGTSAMPLSMDPQMQVDFHTGNKVDSDVAFCFRVCFGKKVVNTRQGGIWGEPAISTIMPFGDGQPFDLSILVQSDWYKVSVNGHEYYKFPCLLDPGSVKMMQVWRDVSLASVIVT
ncbi:galectin-10-like [Pipistrellus kuhlii]|uniref:galectin-10-like n=1 Tax=Pipistrellus kuhlii TaxID=59472 RepID=UPI00174EED15|nr:galectin-10-like [Pipistrellus kuhlii]